MIIRVILLALIIFVLINLISYLKRLPPQQRKALLIKYGGVLVFAVAVLLVVTGRLHWIGAAIAALVPVFRHLPALVVRWLPLINWVRQQHFANPVMTSRFIKLVVEASSGAIRGEVLSGSHQGAQLDNLSETELNELLKAYQNQDPESARLLSAYMQRRFQQAYSGQGGASSGGQMSRSEALQILGLEENASERDIIAAHRSLMQKFHPDRGGSDYLAAKINQAKDFLLNT